MPRRLVRDGQADAASAGAGLRTNPCELDLERHPPDLLLDRVWPFRNRLTAYDAVSAALAEALVSVLLTSDAGLARGPGPGRRVQLVQQPEG